MKTFVEFVDAERTSRLPGLPKLAKLPKLPKLPKMQRMMGSVVDDSANSGPTQKMPPAQAIPQLQQIIMQLSILVRRLSGQ
jgi:hypothetical protein